MPQAVSDCNLLFGILALQMDFIGRDDLIAAMSAWVVDKAPGAMLSQPQGGGCSDQNLASPRKHEGAGPFLLSRRCPLHTVGPARGSRESMARGVAMWKRPASHSVPQPLRPRGYTPGP
jgi:hypothetical protein